MIRISNKLRKPSRLSKRAFSWLLVISVLAGTAAPAFMPFLAQKAAALGTNVNVSIRHEQSAPERFGTCQAYFDGPVRKTTALLSQYFGPKATARAGQDIGGIEIGTHIGFKPDADSNGREQSTPNTFIGATSVLYVLNGIDTTDIPIIRFRAGDASSPVPNDPRGVLPDPGCDKVVMIPISTTEWRGLSTLNTPAAPDHQGSTSYFRFNITSIAADKSSTTGVFNALGDSIQNLRNFVVEGAPNTGGSAGTIAKNAKNAQWVDASQIVVTSNDNMRGEVYQKATWGGAYKYSIYFLTGLGPNSPDSRGALINATQCDTPLDPRTEECVTRANCVPYIAVNNSLSFDVQRAQREGNLNAFQTQLSAHANAAGTLYDYDSNCRIIGQHNINWSSRERSLIWFQYSKKQDKFQIVFPNGEDAERPYIATYSKSSDKIYTGGATGCEAAIYATLPTSDLNAPDIFLVTWKLANQNIPCATPSYYDNSKPVVMVQGGTKGEAGFVTAQEDSQNASTNPANAQQSQPELVCAIAAGPLNWIVCPIFTAAQKFVNALDSAINSQLTINVNKTFNDSDPEGRAYHTAWASFRSFALALIVIAALVMVIAQAMGIEVLDAYTIRKVLPRLLFAAIAITLSWSLLRFFTELSNDFGNGIRSLIYTPLGAVFQNQAINAQLNGGTGTVAVLLAGGGIYSLGGFVGMLSLIFTAAIAVLIGFAMVVFREVLLIFLVISAPLAIACYILPNTQKVWKLWLNSIIGVWLVFLIISAFIALGRVFAVISFSRGTSLSQIVGIIAYFAPYFLIPLAFRLAGGFIATIGGIVNDRSRGIFDGLKNFRKQRRASLNEKFKEGSFTGGYRVFNPIGKRMDLGWQGRFGFGRRGRQAMGIRSLVTARKKLEQNPDLQELANNDDAMAVLMGSGGSERLGLDYARRLFRNADGTVNETRVRDAMAAARAVGFNRANSVAAFTAVPRNKSRSIGAGRTDLVELAAANLAGGNSEMMRSLLYNYAWASRDNGRVDLGAPAFMEPGIATGTRTAGHALAVELAREARARELAREAHGSAGDLSYTPSIAEVQAQLTSPAMANYVPDEAEMQDANADAAMIDGIERKGVYEVIGAHPNTITQLTGIDMNGEHVQTQTGAPAEGTLLRMLRGGRTNEDKYAAGQAIFEIIENYQGMPGANPRIYNQYLAELGIDPNMTRQVQAIDPYTQTPLVDPNTRQPIMTEVHVPIDQQVAELIRREGGFDRIYNADLTGAALRTHSRTWNQGAGDPRLQQASQQQQQGHP